MWERFLTTGVSGTLTAEQRRLLRFHRVSIIALIWIGPAFIYFAAVVVVAAPTGTHGEQEPAICVDWTKVCQAKPNAGIVRGSVADDRRNKFAPWLATVLAVAPEPNTVTQHVSIGDTIVARIDGCEIGFWLPGSGERQVVTTMPLPGEKTATVLARTISGDTEWIPTCPGGSSVAGLMSFEEVRFLATAAPDTCRRKAEAIRKACRRQVDEANSGACTVKATGPTSSAGPLLALALVALAISLSRRQPGV